MDPAEKYPYFIYPDVMVIKGDADAERKDKARRRIAANVGDVPSLRLILGIDPEEFAAFYPDMSKADLSTSDTIDSFLSRFGRDAAVPQAAMEIPDSASEPENRPSTMEEARILIKKHDYAAALEIIMQLRLNNPKKSAYFADQIRFLRKLILNRSIQNNNL